MRIRKFNYSSTVELNIALYWYSQYTTFINRQIPHGRGFNLYHIQMILVNRTATHAIYYLHEYFNGMDRVVFSSDTCGREEILHFIKIYIMYNNKCLKMYPTHVCRDMKK